MPSIETSTQCDPEWKSSTVSQYGVDYIQINCDGDFNLNFRGNTEVGVLPAEAHSGEYAFWSNKGDESDMTLTQMFDFTKVDAKIDLKYWFWYDLEEDYDYLYVEASTDGLNWTPIRTTSGRDQAEDPSGNSYGWAYNGKSNGWSEEAVDLSAYAGKNVTLRFEYVTDAAVNDQGLLLDDISISQIGYSSDFENDSGGWEPQGFVRIQNRLPQ